MTAIWSRCPAHDAPQPHDCRRCYTALDVATRGQWRAWGLIPPTWDALKQVLARR
jgi:hypothetical protein